MDDTWGLTKMTRLEVVIGGEDVPVVTNLFSEVGATGFTAVSNVSGLGHSGYHQGRLLFNDRNALTLLTVVLPAERAGALLAGLRPLLARRSGVLLVSETWVSRPEYFQ
jgi:nitrogen regulatory protein PII